MSAFRAAGAMGFLTTLASVVSRLWQGAPKLLQFIANNASFFYGMAVGVALSAVTRNLWLILAAMALTFLLLKWVGL